MVRSKGFGVGVLGCEEKGCGRLRIRVRCALRLWRAHLDRIDVAPPFIQPNPTQSNQHSAWPVIGIIGGALVFCGTFITRKLAIHPDVRITASKRAAVRGALVLVL